MFSKEDVKNIEGRGTSVEKVESQVERFKKGFPWMDIVAPATPERGIKVLDENGIREAAGALVFCIVYAVDKGKHTAFHYIPKPVEPNEE